jgi:hypothetical protein
MKKTIPCLLAVFSALFAVINPAFAQDKILTLTAPPANISIDGDIKEWGDSLRYYNAEKHLNYSIANSKDTLYVAIRFNDRLDQMKILHAGLTLSIDPRGKKKEAFSITFPLNVQGNTPLAGLNKDDAPGDVTQQERDELMRERITTLRGIKLSGFKDVEDEMITTSNTYGFQAAVNYDQNNYLVCEAAIPLVFFHVDPSAKNEWAFNFKINGVERKQKTGDSGQEGENYGGGRGGRGGGMGGAGMGGSGGMGGGRRGGRGGGSRGQSPGGDMGEMGKSSDFWTKFYLAK